MVYDNYLKAMLKQVQNIIEQFSDDQAKVFTKIFGEIITSMPNRKFKRSIIKKIKESD